MDKIYNGIIANLESYGIKQVKKIIYNPSYEQLFEEETQANKTGFEKSIVTESGALAVDTGIFTGRSPKDKYIVKDDVTENTLWWSTQGKNDNKAISKEIWTELKQCVSNQLSHKTLFVIDAKCGASAQSSLIVRFITEVAWQAHFVKNMFIPLDENTKDVTPDFIVMNGSKAVNSKWKEHGLNSENFIAFNFSEKMQIIGGTWYGGEMKKGMFCVMNYLLPLKGIASMHCAANIDKDNEVSLFFGLSGTGKTTLSTDSHQKLIGDDEHGWDNEGIFNFEGGCYAKVINLDPNSEPDIYKAIKKDALLENVVVDEAGKVDYSDKSKTENTRVSYPIYHIDNIVKPVSKGGHAENIIFLTADAFGVLPPVSVLNLEQVEYYFLSGFTSKMAGTELGITSPAPTFSSCFGCAFLTLPPIVYSNLLMEKMKTHNSRAFLVNTGWNGTGKRISLKDTRAIINSILDKSINKVETKPLPIFNLHVPVNIQGVSPVILDPRNSHASFDIWQEKATSLAKLFIDNFKKFNHDEQGKRVEQSGPKL